MEKPLEKFWGKKRKTGWRPDPETFGSRLFSVIMDKIEQNKNR